MSTIAMTNPGFRWLASDGWCLVCFCVYGVSFLLPVDKQLRGFEYFFLGLMYSLLPLAWPMTLSWFANPLAVYLMLTKRQTRFRTFAGYALIPVALEIQFVGVYIGEPLTGPGYWTWLGSFVMVALRENKLRSLALK